MLKAVAAFARKNAEQLTDKRKKNQ